MTLSLWSSTRYPSGGTPPIHIPFCFDAAILSRMRSPMTSRSNCAKDNSTFSVKRPIDVVVLNCCVTETKEASLASRISTILAKSASEQPLQGRPIHCRAGEAAVVITRGQAHPAFVHLAADERFAGFALRLQRIELLIEPLLGGFAGVDRTANPCAPPCAAARRPHQWPASAPIKALARLFRPKKRGP